MGEAKARPPLVLGHAHSKSRPQWPPTERGQAPRVVWRWFARIGRLRLSKTEASNVVILKCKAEIQRNWMNKEGSKSCPMAPLTARSVGVEGRLGRAARSVSTVGTIGRWFTYSFVFCCLFKCLIHVGELSSPNVLPFCLPPGV